MENTFKKRFWIPALLAGMTVIFFSLLPATVQASALVKPSNNLGLVGYWSMEDGSGVTATDFSGNGNAGTLTNFSLSTSTSNWVAGKRGKALDFDGVDDYVNIGTPDTLTFGSSDYTLSAWVYPTNGSVTATIIERGINTTGNSYEYKFSYSGSSKRVLLEVGDGATTQAVSGVANSAPINQWSHLVCTVASDVMQCYTNGVANGSPTTRTITPYASTTHGYIGITRNSTPAKQFFGQIDDLRVYNRALSPTEIASLYSQDSISKIKNSSRGLVNQYLFDENGGTTAVDKTGQGNNGSLIPVPTGITRVQYRHTYPGGSGTSLAFNSTVTTGNLLVVAASGANGTAISTVTDNCSNTYVQAASGKIGVTTSAVWYAKNVTGGTCTVTVTSDVTDFGMTILEYSGINTGDPVDTTHVDLQKKAGTAFTTSADGLVFVHWANEQSGANSSGVGSGWTLVQHDSSHFDLQEDNVSAVAGSYTPSVGGTDQGSDVLIAVAFKGKSSPGWTGGKFGRALSFDGVSQGVVGTSATLTDYKISNQMSVAAWVQTASTTQSHQTIASYGSVNSGTGNTGFEFRLTTTAARPLFGVGNGTTVIRATPASGSLTANTWYHMVGTFDGTTGTVRVYQDGVEVDSTTDASVTTVYQPAGYKLGVGCRVDSTACANSYLNGKIDDFRLYNRTLSADEVSNLYNSSGEGVTIVNSSRNSQLTSGLVGLWSLDGQDMSGATAYDRSGSGNNGTAVSSPKASIGKIGQALGFNPSSYVSVSGSTLNALEPNGSISLWFAFDSAWNSTRTEDTYLWESEKSATYNQIYLRFAPSNGRLSFGKNASDGANSPEEILTLTSSWAAKQWYHAVFVWEGTAMRIYIDGQLNNSGTKTSGINSVADVARIGNHRVGGLGYPGRIDDVRIYNRALTASEVGLLYSSGE